MAFSARSPETRLWPSCIRSSPRRGDSLAGFIGSILQGATDTTFYVIALYFGSVGVRKIKSALGIGLIADVTGITLAIVLGLMCYGG